MRILAADDDPDILEILHILLEMEGYQTILASDGNQAAALAGETIDLYILDVAMPGKNGFEVCREIRRYTTAPVLFLTAKTQEQDKVTGFSAGGDDYLEKPFSNAELLSRVKALLRRCYIYQPSERTSPMRPDQLTLDPDAKSVLVRGQAVTLTPTEYGILNLLLSYPGKVFSAQTLYETIWNEPYSYSENNTIVVHISNLRKKIEEDPKSPKILKSMWGKGYYVD